MVNNLHANAGDTGDTISIPRLERPTGVGNGNPLQYSCLKNPLDREACWASVHGVAKSQTQLSTHTHIPLNVHTFVLYICVSISALQIGSFVLLL